MNPPEFPHFCEDHKHFIHDELARLAAGMFEGDVEYTDKELYSALSKDGIKLSKRQMQLVKEKDGAILWKIGKHYYENNIDDTRSFAWILRAAEQGHPTAQNAAGFMYKNGEGVSVDYKLAMKWYKKAAAQGYIEAASHIGFLYHHGLGVSPDYKQAIKWYLMAAKEDHTYAISNIGNLYQGGLGVTRNIHTAIEWYTRAANMGEGSECGQYNLGRVYELEKGVKDLQKAINWYQKSADNGFEQAKKHAKELNKKGYYAKEEKRDDDIFDDYNETRKIDFNFTNMGKSDDNVQDDLYRKLSILEKQNMPSRDALKKVLDILEQERNRNTTIIKDKRLREKFVLDYCLGASDDDDDDDDDE